MKADGADAVRRMPHADPDDEWLIPDCYLYFYDKFMVWLNEDGGDCLVDRLDILYHTLVDSLHVVGIDLDQEDDAQEIFETLNYLGAPLSPSDLVKNYLFRSAVEKKLDATALYEEYWKTYETDKRYWRQEIRQGRLKRPRIDLFLYHYLTLKWKEITFDSQLFTSFKEYFGANHAQDPAKYMAEHKMYSDIYRQIR